MTYQPGFSKMITKLVVTAALLAILALQGCAPKTVQPPVQLPLSKEGELTYNYLVYMDYRSRLGQIMSQGKTPQTINEAAIIQKDALEVLNKIIAVEPSVQLYMDKFAIYWTSQQLDEARDTLKEALKKYPHNRDLTISLANTYLVDNRSDDAEAILKEFLLESPDDLIITTHLARIYLEQKKFAQGLDILKVIPQEKRTPRYITFMAKPARN